LKLQLFTAVALLAAAGPVMAQSVVPARRVPKEWLEFRALEGEGRIDCNLTQVKPRLNFSFRFQTGFVATFPGRQYVGRRHWIATFFRVTPAEKEREPVYFLSTTRLPDIPPNKVTLETGGGFVIGEGKYRVDWLMTDDSGRVCVKDWTLEAKLGRKERDVQPGMAPGTADEISLRKWTRGSKGADDAEGHRVTILMNAAPVLPRRVRLGAYDRVLLLSSLASLVERLRLRSVRLVVFSLDQQREVYRTEDFSAADFDKLATAVGRLELGTVDYDILKNRLGHQDLLAELISESLAQQSSDAVLFVGPKPRQFDRMARSLLPDRKPGQPPFFYLQFRPAYFGPNFPDVIMSAVKQMGGKTYDVFSPGDFAEAIRQISKTLDDTHRVVTGE
jgi:hypothetical protein